MTTVYVVPCGTSVLDDLGGKLHGGGSRVGAFVREVEKGAWLSGTSPDKAESVLSAWTAKAAPKASAAALQNNKVPKRLSAETHSLATHAKLPGLAPGDRVVLLASDTDRGLSAAFCVAHYLARGVCTQLSYTSTPEKVTDPFRLPTGQQAVTVVRIRGLAPGVTDFSGAVAGIGKVLRAVWDTDATVEVHLTGGFKATLLHTLAMSEVLHSLAPNRLSALYVFDEDPDTKSDKSDQPIAPVSIGLRAFSAEHIELMQSELDGALHNHKTGSRTFEGVGWSRKADGTRNLTDFGYGYLAILGKLSASLGDDNQ